MNIKSLSQAITKNAIVISIYALGILLLSLASFSYTDAGWSSYGYWNRLCKSPSGDKVLAHFTRAQNATYDKGVITVGNQNAIADLRNRTSELIQVSASPTDTVVLGISSFSSGGGKGGGGFTVSSLATCDAKSYN